MMALLGSMILSVARAQPAWQLEFGSEIKSPQIAPSGNYLIYQGEKNDSDVMECVDMASGKVLWTRAYKDYEETSVFRFIDSTRFLAGDENQYLFLNAADGKVLKTLPIAGDDWSDLVKQPKTDPGLNLVQPWFRDSVGIFYFSDGFQIVDLLNPAILYQSECSPSKIVYKEWEKVLLIDMHNSCDSIFFVDTEKRKLVYRASKDEHDINDRAYQSFVTFKDQMLVFEDVTISSVDLTTGKLNAVLEIDPTDPDVFMPILTKNDLFLLTSQDNVQRLYNPKLGKLLWETPEGEIPGVVDELTVLDNNQGFLYGYADDGVMTLYKIDMSNGKVLWKKPLFKQENSYRPGHMRTSSTLASIGAIALSVVANSLGNAGSFHFGNGPYTTTVYSVNWNAVYASTLVDKASDGYAKTLDYDNNRLSLVTAGKIYSELESGEHDEYDGEVYMTIDLNDGRVISSESVDLLKDSEQSDFNAVKGLRVVDHDPAKLLVGAHDVYVRIGDFLDRFSFGPSNVFFLDSGNNMITIVADSLDEHFDYWTVDVSSSPPKRVLMARTDEKNFVLRDSALIGMTLNITEDDIAAYPLVAGEPTFTNPLWKFNREDLGIGSFPIRTGVQNPIQGVRFSKNGDVIIMGEEGLARISKDGKCKWAQEWSPASARAETQFPLKEVGNAIVYSTDDDTRLIRNDCSGETIGRHEIGNSDVRVMTSNESYVAVVNTDEGIINGYVLK